MDDFLKKKIEFTNVGEISSEIREFEVEDISIRGYLEELSKSTRSDVGLKQTSSMIEEGSRKSKPLTNSEIIN